MSDLVTWLRAQLDEDERRAPLAAEVMALRPSTAPFGARLLAEVEVKRRIIERAEQYGRWAANDDAPGFQALDEAGKLIVRLLALPYADRPGYHEEWAP